MNDFAISIEGLSKRYRLGGVRPFRSLRESIAGLFSIPAESRPRTETGMIWALREVSFRVRAGEAVGLIGRNGAGKSTLLKVLARITEPTEGRAIVDGRVGSLLEVGTGFHPELTGSENIYLNGAVLGMKRAEIRSKFKEIVEFAEVGDFIETPVKHYSSGMYLRLAFSVAAHFEPEILFVDEVLAVGDAQFQQKCMGRMGEVAREGRTVLFVSHNLGAVSSLCERAIWLDRGQVGHDGSSQESIRFYLESLQQTDGDGPVIRSSDGRLEIRCVRTLDHTNRPTNSFPPRSSVTVEMEYLARESIDRPYLWVGVASRWGMLFCANGLLDGVRPVLSAGCGRLRCTFRELPLLPQQSYVIRVGGRAPDGRTPLLPTTDVAHITIVGSARDVGLCGELAESVVGSSAPVLVAYNWELPDGTIVDREGTSGPGSHGTTDFLD